MEEQTYHAESNDGNTCWKDNNRSTDLLLVTESSECECEDGCENIRRSGQELRIARRVAHSIHQDNGEEIGKCIACGGQTTEEEGEAPIVNIANIAPELLGSKVVVLRVNTISLDTIEHPFSLFFGEECIFVRKVLDSYNKYQNGKVEWREKYTEEANDTGQNSSSSKDDKYPLPPVQAMLASELWDTTSNCRGESTDLYVI